MIFWIILGAAISAVLWNISKIIRRTRRGEPGLSIFLIVGLWPVYGLLFPVLIQGVSPASQYTVTQEYGLAALATRTDQPWGYFFLGSGVVDDKLVYRYLSVDEDGGIKMKTASVDSSTVYEGDGDPHMTVVTHYNDNWWATPFAVPVPRSSDYSFYVPEGSVIRGYEVRP